jgi:hypothetical protein
VITVSIEAVKLVNALAQAVMVETVQTSRALLAFS